ncbi:hypothetical protein [Amycolatopsis sp. DG1A-15b]|uniref:hypothetical protein n=1 Tax=Amycolatopsis sp. DG1A-15b TaxID=3052846 RepID=UPI00255B5EA7|nr:hypothetical protein [Amycolatopsis sp. DG1A-15b]WIX92471.1 hypothetical protein QRY02_19335 [Amycolatopsis sp. DG1A-15b]
MLAASGDITIAKQVAGGLADLGVAAEVNPSVAADRAVVVVSADAASDVAWREAVRAHEQARLVPVAVGPVDAGRLPAAVTDPNWITWSTGSAPARLSEIFAALHSDMSRYRTHRVLAASAAGWQAAGRPDHLLIGEHDAVEDAVRHLTDAAHDPLATPTALIREYVDRSRLGTTGLRRKRNRRWVIRTTATLVAIAVAVTVFVLIRAAGSVNNLQFQATTVPWLTQSRPDRTAMLAAGLLLQADDDHKAQPRGVTFTALGQPWSHGLVGAMHASIALAVLDRTGDHTLSLDTQDTLTLWDNRSLDPVWQHPTGAAARAADFDADPALSRIALATESGIELITREPWNTRSVPLPERPSAVAQAANGHFAAVATSNGNLYTVGFAAGPVSAPVHFDAILDLRQTEDGGLRALVRSGDDLLVVDPATGARSQPFPFPEHRFAQAALAPDGRGIAAAGPDRQLYYTDGDGPLHPTGQALADITTLLTVLPSGRIVYGGAEFGVHVYDTRAGITVGQVCRTETPVLAVRAAADGDLLACLDSYIADLWRSREFGPLPTGPKPAGRISRSPSATDGALSATGRPDGRLDITWKGARWQVPVSGSPVVAVSVDAAARSVVTGAEDGTVLQFAVGDSVATRVVRWSVPDGAPVTAVGTLDSRRLLVGTGRGLWWAPASCDRCDDDQVLVQHVRERLWGCYTENQFEFLDDNSRERLGIRSCPAE